HGAAARDPVLDSLDERKARTSGAVVVAAHDASAAIDDGADRVHDGENRQLRRADRPERAALPAGLGLFEAERLADRRRPSRPAAAERKASLPSGPERSAAELLVRIDRVVATAPVEDDRTGDSGDRHPAGVEVALC